MQTKTLIQLTLILCLGIAAIFGRDLWEQYQQKQPNAYITYINQINKADINEINLKQGASSLVLKKDKSDWKIMGKLADNAKVTELINALFPETSPIIIGKSREQRDNFGLQKQVAIQLTFKTVGNKSISLDVGRQTGISTAVSLPGDQQIFGLRNLPQLSSDPQPWFDLKVVDIDSKDIKKITFTHEYEPFTVIQTKDQTWSFEDKTIKTNSDGLNTFTLKLNPLIGNSLLYEDKLQNYTMEYSPFSITIDLASGKQITLTFYPGSTEESDYVVKRSTDNSFFTLSPDTAKEFDKQKDSFIMPSIPE